MLCPLPFRSIIVRCYFNEEYFKIVSQRSTFIGMTQSPLRLLYNKSQVQWISSIAYVSFARYFF